MNHTDYNRTVTLSLGLVPVVLLMTLGVLGSTTEFGYQHFFELVDTGWFAFLVFPIPTLTALFARPQSADRAHQLLERLRWALISSALFLIGLTVLDTVITPLYLRSIGQWPVSGNVDPPVFNLFVDGGMAQLIFASLLTTLSLALAWLRTTIRSRTVIEK